MWKRLLAPAALLALAACRGDAPEAQVRKAFQRACAAVEAGDAAGASEALDPAFQGPEGLDWAAARLYLAGLLRQDKVGLTVLRDDIAVQRDTALQEVDLVLTSRGGGLLPRDASRRGFLLRWRKGREGWRLVELSERGGV